MKTAINYEINYPLKQRTVCDLKMVTIHHGELRVTGTAYKSGDSIFIDIDFVYFNGTDIKAVLEALDQLFLIEEYIQKQALRLFTSNIAA